MNKILTVVIPTYNMEKYLRKCLDSLVIEDKELFNLLEVLVIIDGGKDSSSAIAHEYQDKIPDVFRVIDKENGNYGSCVNRGLNEAKGKYIKILDADDSFNTKEFTQYISKLSYNEADLIITDYVLVNEKDRVFARCSYEEIVKDKLISFYELPSSVYKKMAMHAVTYKTDMLKWLEYHQTEGISYTDQEWIFLPMSAVKSIISFDINLYRYLIGREGQTMQTKVRHKSISQENTVLRSLIACYSKLDNLDLCHKNYLRERLVIRMMDTYAVCMSFSDTEIINILKETDKYLSNQDYLFYQESNSFALPGTLGYKFIERWRKGKEILPWPIKIGWFLSQKLISLKTRLKI